MSMRIGNARYSADPRVGAASWAGVGCGSDVTSGRWRRAQEPRRSRWFRQSLSVAATPQAYQFGVCSAAVAGESSPLVICGYNPADVPYLMDTIPPGSVNMQTELDPTQNPSGVELQGVTVP